MRKLRETFNFIREKLRNPRTRAATILGLYFIFFIFVIVWLRSVPTNTTNNESDEKIVNYSEVQKSYDYQYNIEISTTDDSLKYLITGNYNKENEIRKIEFYNNETNSYEITNEYEFVNDKLLVLDNIISYVNNLESEFSTNYKDGTIQKNYLVPINKIDEYLENNNTIEINVYKKDDFITKIILDTTNLDKVYNENILKVKYTLEYKNLNETVDNEG